MSQGLAGTISKMFHGNTYCFMVGDGDESHCAYYYLDDEELIQHFPPNIVEALRKLNKSEDVECRFVPNFTFKVTEAEKESMPSLFSGPTVTIEDLFNRVEPKC